MNQILLAALLATGCDDAPSRPPREPPAPPERPAAPAPVHTGTLRFTAPDGWISEAPSSAMRQAQFRAPRADGDSEDAELAVFHFGAGLGGSVEANLDRWVAQIAQPDGTDSHARTKIDHREVRRMPVTILDVSGTYVASSMPGAPVHGDQSGFRMLAAVVESPAGPWFVKLVGPARTVEKWEAAFGEYVDSATLGP